MFIKSLQKLIGCKVLCEDGSEEVERKVTTKKDEKNVYAPQIIEQIRVKGIYDPLLQQNFTALFNKDTFHSISLTGRDDRLEKYVTNHLWI